MANNKPVHPKEPGLAGAKIKAGANTGKMPQTPPPPAPPAIPQRLGSGARAALPPGPRPGPMTGLPLLRQGLAAKKTGKPDRGLPGIRFRVPGESGF
jgi:hypothetical protein